MKLSAILVSVNLVAVLPVAARAAEETVSDKAAWLKQNLVPVEATRKNGLRKVSLSDAGVTKPVSLRPFMRNRHLPSQRELMEQTARFDNMPSSKAMLVPQMGQTDQPLSGQIAAYELSVPEPAMSAPVMAAPAARRAPRRATRAPMPRSVAGQIPVMPGQILPQSNQENIVPVIPEPLPLPGSIVSVPAAMPARPPIQAQAPVLSPQERAMMQALVELNQPGKTNEFRDLPGMQSAGSMTPEAPMDSNYPYAPNPAMAGQAPFPLSLLPPAALQGLLGHRGVPNAPRATFGSWHQPMKVSGLPYGGFQTHIVRGRVNTGSFHENAQPRQRKHAPVKRSAVHPANVIVPTAMYPAYYSNSRTGSF